MKGDPIGSGGGTQGEASIVRAGDLSQETNPVSELTAPEAELSVLVVAGMIEISETSHLVPDLSRSCPDATTKKIEFQCVRGSR